MADLAAALKALDGYKGSDSAPYGRQVTKGERKKLTSAGDLHPLAEFLRNHPAETLGAIASIPILPEGLAGIGLAGLLAGGTRVIDKTHPLTDEASDFDTKSARDNAQDIMLHSMAGSAGAGLRGALGLLARDGGAEAALAAQAEQAAPKMASGYIPAPKSMPLAKVTSELSPAERNAAVIKKLVDMGGKKEAEQALQEGAAQRAIFRDYIPSIDKNVQMYFPNSVQRMGKEAGKAGFRLFPGTTRFGTNSSFPKELLDKHFLR